MDGAIIDELVQANQILFDQGVVDAFGHVSVRHPERRDRLLIARSVAPASVNAGDILEMDLDGRVVGGRTGSLYVERFIHTELYRRYAAVEAVVHSHSPSVIPFGVTPTPLKAIFHLGSFLGARGVPIFEIRDWAEADTDLLIRTRKLGEALAGLFEGGCAVLQRGHGSTVVGGSLREVVFRAVYLEVNARLQAQAINLGPITYLSEAEAALATAVNAVAGVDRAWSMWTARLKSSRPGRDNGQDTDASGLARFADAQGRPAAGDAWS